MIAIMTLVVLVVYLSFVIAVSKWVYKKPETVSSKWLASIGTAICLLFVPMADNIVGEVYLKYLCATQGGIHVYQTVELGPEYFKGDGTPIFYDRNKGLHEMSMRGKYVGRSESEVVSKILNVRVVSKKIENIEDNTVLGESIYFVHFGGKLVNSTGLHVSGTSCPSSNARKNHIKKLSKLVFLQQGIN